MLVVYCLTLPGSIEPRTLARLLDAVQDDRREVLARFRDRRDALRGACGELLARHVLSIETRMPPAEVRFSRDANGKPSPPAGVRRRFNISHAGDLVVCATADAAVGVDVERIGPIDRETARAVLDAAEFDRFRQLPVAESRAFFFDRWTIRESFLKAVGTGLAIEPGSLRVEEADDGPFITRGDGTYFCRRYAAADGYALCACSADGAFAPGVTEVPFLW